MAAVSEYIAHFYSAVVSPNDHSGSGVWNMSEPLPVRGTQRNEHYAYDGLALNKPEGLSGLQSRLVEIENQQYKCAPIYLSALEHDEGATFADTMAGKEGRDIIIAVRAWGVEELGRSANLETRIYWTKLINSDNLEFGVFAAAITRIADDRSTEPSKYVDLASGSSKLIETPAGRLNQMKSSAFSPDMSKASSEAVNLQLLDL